MKVQGVPYRTIWVKPDDPKVICLIDQRFLPHRFVIEDIETVESMAIAIRDMHVRGAGLIGASAGFGMYLAALEAAQTKDFQSHLDNCYALLKDTRPTAVNLAWALDRQMIAMAIGDTPERKIALAIKTAQVIADEDASYCRRIGEHGLEIIEAISQTKKDETVNILTHCNAGWLAFVDHGSATSPIYAAHDAGIKVHVYVDETRPRNQGAQLTAWELGEHGVNHTVIVDNAGGHLMQHGMVDLVITGTDRTTCTGDVANKIGTYLKALAAKDNNIPFYVALPSSTFDWEMEDGLAQIPIEERDPTEVKFVQGLNDGNIREVLITPPDSPVANYAFDVTPARLVTGLITERGICQANKDSILELFPERKV